MTTSLSNVTRMLMASIAVVGVAAGLAGCISDQPTRPSVQGRAPTDPKVTKLVLTTAPPSDTDSNGFPDTMKVLVHLFEEPPGGWPLSVAVPGTFRFELIDSKLKLVTTWTFEGKLSEAAAFWDDAGACYRFDLSLLEGGRTDRRNSESFDMKATFIPAKGGVSPTNTASQRYGRTR